jgi:hypothetical protein
LRPQRRPATEFSVVCARDPQQGEDLMPTNEMPTAPNASAELLYLLHGDPADFADAVAALRAVEIAEALRQLSPDAAAKVIAALPFDLAVQVFDEPELEHHRFDIIMHMDERTLGPLVDAMSGDQQADLFRELPEKHRSPSTTSSTRSSASRPKMCRSSAAWRLSTSHTTRSRSGG